MSKSSLQLDIDPHEALPSASNTNHFEDNLSNDTPPVSTLVDIYGGEAMDPVYQAKSHVLSCVIQEIGMGRYQVSYGVRT